MITSHTPETLRAFEADVAAEYNAGHIRAPIHLSGGNEADLIRIFHDVKPQDWVCGTWRMHYQCLLKGVQPDLLKRDILAGKSITLCYPEHRIISSAIVGGILPIAVGLAWAAKRAGESHRVFAFIGDMTAHTGIFHECSQYAIGHDLPITFVREDNGKSVSTPTRETWTGNWPPGGRLTNVGWDEYSYELPWPHSGAGKRIEF